jgi:hypothetical protein
MPTNGPSYTSINDYLSANQGTIANEGAKVAGDVSGQLSASKQADDAALAGKAATPGDFTTAPGYGAANEKQTAALQAAQGLNSPSGLAGLLQNNYGGSANYNQDQANWDGQLLGASNQQGFAPVQAQAKSLTGYLQAGPKAAAPDPGDQNPANPTGNTQDAPINYSSTGPAGVANKLGTVPGESSAAAPRLSPSRKFGVPYGNR